MDDYGSPATWMAALELVDLHSCVNGIETAIAWDLYKVAGRTSIKRALCLVLYAKVFYHNRHHARQVRGMLLEMIAALSRRRR
jgi:hypothetical protein